MRKIAVILIVFYSHILIAQDISFADSSIKADGILDEVVWSTIQPFDNFHNFFPVNEGKATFDTEVRIFHDGKYLNVAFVYHDSLSEVRVNSFKAG